MTHLQTLLFTLSSFIFIACGPGSDAPTSKFNKDSLSLAQKTTQSEILNAINKARSVARDCHDGNGIVDAAPALTWNEKLYASAYEHSYDLAQSNTFSHYGSGTTSDVTGSNNNKKSYFNERIRANGYVEYKTIGENVAGGQESIEKAVTAWLESPAHCTNMMNPNFKEVGVAVVINEESDYGIYWTENFGGKK